MWNLVLFLGSVVCATSAQVFGRNRRASITNNIVQHHGSIPSYLYTGLQVLSNLDEIFLLFLRNGGCTIFESQKNAVVTDDTFRKFMSLLIVETYPVISQQQRWPSLSWSLGVQHIATTMSILLFYTTYCIIFQN